MGEALEFAQAVVRNPVIRSAAIGACSAAAVDYRAFLSWKSFDDAMAYDWNVAAWRWLQGAVIGATTGFGLSWMF